MLLGCRKIKLPIILDPSHAMGYSYAIPSLSKACVAMGVDGLLIEAHPNPKIAKQMQLSSLTILNLKTFNVLDQLPKGYNII